MSSQNRFNALLGDENTEIDKLGNAKPAEKKDDNKAPTRREIRQAGFRQPAVSPPSRRGPRNPREVTEGSTDNASNNTSNGLRAERQNYSGAGEHRKRQFDRHSGTGIYDTKKQIEKGWGEPGTAELQGAHDVLNSNDPDAAESRQPRQEEVEENTKTLDEYLSEKKATSNNFRLESRKANEGVDENQWKDAIVLKKEEDVIFAPGKGTKIKKPKKEGKVHLEIDQPAHRSSYNDRGRGRGGRGGRGGNNRNSGGRHNQGSVNLDDSKAFPTLGA